MARKANRGNTGPVTVSNSTPKWYLAKYIRLSKEDYRKMRDDSDSVVNQRAILDEFHHNNADEFESAETYIDDGYTGTDTQRKDFQRLLTDIYAKKINCVVVKDLSRFSRSSSDAGNLIEYVFVKLGVRFISLHERIDSYKRPESLNSILFPITNVINEDHCRQTSAKVREVFDNKRRNGQFIGGWAPYGYQKDPADKNSFVIDETAAATVQTIFGSFVEGMSKNGIAKKLNSMGIPNPSAYKREIGLTYKNPNHTSSASDLWSARTVGAILENPVYIGTMVQGRYRVMSYKVHDQIAVPKEDWYMVEDMHDPIITKELFEKVQALLIRDTRTAPGKNEVYLFSGFLRCNDCNAAMTRHRTGKYVYYCCRTFRDKSREACTKHSIRDDVLEDAVTTTIQKQIDLVVDMRDMVREINAAPAVQKRSIQLEKVIEAKEKELEKVNRYKRNLYQDMCDEIISRSEYKTMRAEYEAEAEQIQAVIDNLQEECRIAAQGVKDDNPVLNEFIKYSGFGSLTRDILTALVDCIYIKEGGGVVIKFKFSDHFKRILEFIENNGKRIALEEHNSATISA